MKSIHFLVVLSVAATYDAVCQSVFYEPAARVPQGIELVAVYFTSSDCGPCKSVEFKDLLEDAKVALRDQASKHELGFAAIGVSLDWDAQVGIELLNTSGRFDEVVAGRNWFNVAAEVYVWKGENVVPAMPQVVLVTRSLTAGPGGATFGDTTPLASYAGDELVSWMKNGALVRLD